MTKTQKQYTMLYDSMKYQRKITTKYWLPEKGPKKPQGRRVTVGRRFSFQLITPSFIL